MAYECGTYSCYVHRACRCEACTEATKRYRRGRVDRLKADGLWPLPVTAGQHGTLTGYGKQCRCDACRSAWNAYQRAHKFKRDPASPTPYLTSDVFPGREIVHGRTTTYGYGCRCPDCREAYRLYQRDYRARKKAAAI